MYCNTRFPWTTVLSRYYGRSFYSFCLPVLIYISKLADLVRCPSNELQYAEVAIYSHWREIFRSPLINNIHLSPVRMQISFNQFRDCKKKIKLRIRSIIEVHHQRLYVHQTWRKCGIFGKGKCCENGRYFFEKASIV